jgi:hypothetical protein
VDRMTTPMFVALRRLQPPGTEAAPYAEYLQVNESQLGVLRDAEQLAAAGQASAAVAKLQSGGDSSAVDRDAAALGFKTCD